MSAAIRCTDLVKTYEGRPPVEAVSELNLTVETYVCHGCFSRGPTSRNRI